MALLKRGLVLLMMAVGINQTQAGDTLSEDELWSRLKMPGHVALMRHARVTGFGDPSGFDINDCSTQRNLGPEGHRQAEQMGQILASHGVRNVQIISSNWCRCFDTGTDLGLGTVIREAMLDPVDKASGSREQQSLALNQWLDGLRLSEPTILITHQINITYLTETSASPGQIQVAQRLPGGQLRYLGSINLR